MWNQSEVNVAVGEVAAGCSDVRKAKVCLLPSTGSDIQYPFKGTAKQVESFISALLEFKKKYAAVRELQKDTLSKKHRTSQSHQRHFKNCTPKAISSKQSHLRNYWHFDNNGYNLSQNFTKQ
ncbi:hypothetical protein DFQ29_000507 [Apophysomyces sp. BC1021]|nr:hypothetical protein DFQ29_000507 [Apophysomyces sp. BC1021]